jgi:hypothetical protein
VTPSLRRRRSRSVPALALAAVSVPAVLLMLSACGGRPAPTLVLMGGRALDRLVSTVSEASP